uniref:Protein kinase domain-containing protein n=1 Tax=Rhizophagus irregularis (strain DAOM 181602 / DAOM 197198 / MUCL 43194) TaxID=747089 RepID=U9UP15_RHIID
MASQNNIKCKNCSDFYTNIKHKWCKPCQINKVNSLKNNIANSTSGNEKIDYFIQEAQLKFESYKDTIVEWIPYNQFSDIKEISKGNFATVYSAIWNDGPLQHDEHYEELRRTSNKEVILKRLYNLQNIINDLLYEARVYSIEKRKYAYLKIYGISQNPDTKDYILVFNDGYCLNCGKIVYTYKWCRSCQINNLKNRFENWTSGNEKIDRFIQKMQLMISYYDDIIVEWIPYGQFNNIKEISKSDFTAIYSAKWKDGLLQFDKNCRELKRELNKEVALKYFYSSQNINDFLFEIKSYSINKFSTIPWIYGISKNPDTKDYIVVLSNDYCENCSELYTDIYYKWCKPCLLNNLRINFNFTSWTSGNEKIDELIQEMQLKINKWNDIIVEWVPYNQFNDVKEISKSNFAAVYLAVWKDGPLQRDEHNEELKRTPNKEIALKCLYNSQSFTNDEFLKEVKSYSIEVNSYNRILNMYGISQNPNTKDYIIVLDNAYCENCSEVYTNIREKWCKTCQLNNFKKYFSHEISRNEKIDDFIQEMQFEINKWNDIIIEWIPYNQFINIKEIGEIGFTTIYSAIWKNGPLQHDKHYGILKRISDKKVTLRCLHNSQKITNEFLNEVVKEFSIVKEESSLPNLFGISQNPDTQDYIIVVDNDRCETCNKIYTVICRKWCNPCVLNNLRKAFVNWTSGNEIIDNFIQEMQLKINNCNDLIVEWIPYNQFNNIKEIIKNDSFAVYTASSNQVFSNVLLKKFFNSQNITNEFLNEV